MIASKDIRRGMQRSTIRCADVVRLRDALQADKDRQILAERHFGVKTLMFVLRDGTPVYGTWLGGKNDDE